VARPVGQNLLRERIHTATRFSTADCAEDGNPGEQASLGNHEPLRVFCGDLFAGIVNFPDDQEKIVSLPGVWKEGQSSSSDSLPRLESKNIQAGQRNGIPNIRGRGQEYS